MEFFRTLTARLFQCGRRRSAARSGLQTTEGLEQRTLLTAVQLTDREQLLLELINRARANPEAEAARLGISLNEGLQPGTITGVPKQPLVPHQTLVDVARAHSQDMLDRDYFDHKTLGTTKLAQDRAAAAGYSGAIGENICWGGHTRGIDEDQHVYDRHDVLFVSPGHRRNMLNAAYEEVGVGVRYGQFVSNGTAFNASMVTEDFSIRNINPFITGLVYADLRDNDFYDIGESIRSGTVTAINPLTGVVAETEIGVSGCYSLMVTPGKWLVSAEYIFEGQTFRASRMVTVDQLNVKVDFERFTDSQLSIAVSASNTTLSELVGVTTSVVTVSRTEPDPFPLTFSISSSDPAELDVPGEITIPSGQTTQSFTVRTLPDNVVDPGKQTSVTLTAENFAPAAVQFTVNDRTTPLLPQGIQVVRTTRPTLTWTAVSNAREYEVWIDNATTRESKVVFADRIQSNSWTLDRDLGIGNYNVWVRALTDSGVRGNWSPTGVWQTRPTVAISNTGSIQKSSSATLEWLAVPGAVSYDVWVDHLTSRKSQYFRNTSVTGTSLVIPDVAVGRIAVWLRARNSRGELTPWGNQGIINVSHAVQGLKVEASNFQASPELRWTAQQGAVAYEVWIDNKLTGQKAWFRNINVTGTSIALTVPADGSFRVWVRGKDASGAWHQWSTALDFEVRRPPVLLQPASVISTAWPTYQWSRVAGAVAYDFLLQDSDGQNLVVSKGMTTTTLASKDNLRGGQYRVWLTAIDAQGATLSGPAWTFRVSQVSPTDEFSLEQLNSELLADSSPLRTMRERIDTPAPTVVRHIDAATDGLAETLSITVYAAELNVAPSFPHMAELYGVQAEQTLDTGLLDMIFAVSQWS